MPSALTYPGVYIEEIPSGVRTITGVATSITAFVGRTLRGPIDEDEQNSPVTINSYAEFERIFGGLWAESTLGFAVRDFFLNGGGQALIVRVYKDAPAPAKSTAKLKADNLNLKAASPGAWGGKLRVRIDHETRTEPAFPGEDINKIFNLTVKDTQTAQIEMFRNVSVAVGHPRRVEKVLENESTLLRVDGGVPAARPAKDEAIATGDDPDPFSDDFTSRYSVVSNANQPSDGAALTRADISASSLEAGKTGMYALLRADLFNLLCIPPHTPSTAVAPKNVETGLVDDATLFCKNHRAFFIIDPPYNGGINLIAAKTAIKGFPATITTTNYAALYFPTLMQPNPLHDDQIEEFAPCGAVAGVIARTDAQRGVWKAPAGQEATLVGVPQLSAALGDGDNGELNPLGINCLRALPAAGRVVWGARTMEGNDRLASEWKYIPVRRLALYLEESLYRGTKWVVFEPNDEPLWSQIRLNLGAFMQGLFRQGAFQGKTPQEAYFVKCDKETTTQNDINLGIVNILVGFAPLKPAEFVVIKIQQMAGQIAT